MGEIQIGKVINRNLPKLLNVGATFSNERTTADVWNYQSKGQRVRWIRCTVLPPCVLETIERRLELRNKTTVGNKLKHYIKKNYDKKSVNSYTVQLQIFQISTSDKNWNWNKMNRFYSKQRNCLCWYHQVFSIVNIHKFKNYRFKLIADHAESLDDLSTRSHDRRNTLDARRIRNTDLGSTLTENKKH